MTEAFEPGKSPSDNQTDRTVNKKTRFREKLSVKFAGIALIASIALSGCATAVTNEGLNPSERTRTDTTLRDGGLDVPILVYHGVDTQPLLSAYGQESTVPRYQFEEEINYLAENGYHTITMEQVYNALEKNVPLPEKSVAITFDDGYSDQNDAAAILEKYGLDATFFAITDFVGVNGHFKYLNWGDLKKMQEAGMDIESHTTRHPNLTAINDTKLNEELAGSKEAIKEHLGTDANILCYPGGKYNQKVIDAAKTDGYLAAVTIEKDKVLQKDRIYSLPRISIGPKTTLNDFKKDVK